MKYLVIIIGILIFTACRPENSNNEATLTEIFSNSQIRFEMKNCGCFGCGDTEFKITRLNKKYIVNGDDIKQELVISEEQFLQIKDYVSSKTLSKSKSRFFCTMNTEYRIGSYWTYVKFSDESCSVLEDLMKIIEKST